MLNKRTPINKTCYKERGEEEGKKKGKKGKLTSNWTFQEAKKTLHNKS